MTPPKTTPEPHIVVSTELLKLLHVLLEYEYQGLQALIKRVVEQGYLAQYHLSPENPGSQEAMQEQVTHFFAAVEAMFQETSNEHLIAQYLQKALIPAINHIDSSQCDTHIIAKTAAHIQEHPAKNGEMKETFCKALLKNWQPAFKQEDTH